MATHSSRRKDITTPMVTAQAAPSLAVPVNGSRRKLLKVVRLTFPVPFPQITTIRLVSKLISTKMPLVLMALTKEQAETLVLHLLKVSGRMLAACFFLNEPTSLCIVGR